MSLINCGRLLISCAVIQVTMADFLKALEEVKPAFGAATESLNAYCLHGIINCGENFDHLLSTLRMLVHQVGPDCVVTLLVLDAPARASLLITC